MPLARSLARSHACARAGTSRATEHTCADELLQLRQQLAAQGAELQQLRQSNAALVAAADATASRSRDASARRKRRAITSATDKAHDGMAEVQQEWEQERDELLEEIGVLQLRPAANNAEEVELLGLFRRFQAYYPDRKAFGSTQAPPWAMVRNLLKAMVDGPLHPSHVSMKWLRWVLRNAARQA